MKQYRRTEPRGPYTTITTVSEDGEYLQVNRWPGYEGSPEEDVVVTKDNIFRMGWPSLQAFLKSRKGFTLVKEEESKG